MEYNEYEMMAHNSVLILPCQCSDSAMTYDHDFTANYMSKSERDTTFVEEQFGDSTTVLVECIRGTARAVVC